MSARLLFQKALLLLDQGNYTRGAAILRDTITAADTEGDAVTALAARVCLGDLLLEIGQREQASVVLRAALALPNTDQDDVLQQERGRARDLLTSLEASKGDV